MPVPVRLLVWAGVAALLLGGVAAYAARGPAILMELAADAGRFLCL
jgi:hypothetical protein